MHLHRFSHAVNTLLLSFSLAACSGSGGSDSTVPPGGSANFTFGYGPAGGTRFDLVYRNVPIDPWAPTVTPAVAVANFTIAPPLPPGLTLDPNTGVISGQPTGVGPARRYVVTAVGPGGSTDAEIELGIVNPPRFALAANEGDSTFSTYFIDPLNGELEYRAYTSTEVEETGPAEVQVHPSGEYLFTLNREGNSVSVYTIDSDEGFVRSSSVTGMATEPSLLAVHPTGRYLYVTERNLDLIRFYEFDAGAGVLSPGATPSFPVNATVNGIVLHPNGRFLYVTSRTESKLEAYEIDQATGALTFMFSQPTFSTPSGISLDSSGRALYFVTDQFDLIVRWQLDPATGALFDPSTRPTDTDPSSINLHPSSRFVYVTNRGSNTITKYTVLDPSTGRLGQPVLSAVGSKPLNISFDPIGHFAFVVNQQSDNISVFRVNSQTGNLTSMETLRTRSQPSALVMIQGEAPVRRRASHAYVTSGGSDDVTTFELIQTNGTAVQVGLSPLAGDRPSDITVDPFGRFAIVSNEDSDDLTVFGIADDTGALSQVGLPVPCGDAPSAVAIDPSGRFVYVTNRIAQTISSFSLDRETGELTAVDLDVTSNPQPTDIAIDPTGQNLYVVNEGSADDPTQNGDVTVFDIEPTTGQLTRVQGGVFAGGSPSSLTFDRTGRYAIATKRSGDALTVSLVDQLSGTIESGPGIELPSEREPTDIALTPDGRFAFAALFDNGNQGRVATYRVDTMTSQLIATGAVTDGANPLALITDPTGRTLYVVNFGSEDLSFFSIDPETGLISILGSAPTGLQPSSIALREMIE